MSRTSNATVLLVLVGISALGLGACADDPPLCPATVEKDESADVGPSTEAVCDGSPLTYDNFGREFMETYCTRCHSSSVKGEEARHCAPDDHNFDTLDEVVLTAKHIDQQAAAGPGATNTVMPPSGGAIPNEAERRDLGTWLACELERMPQ